MTCQVTWPPHLDHVRVEASTERCLDELHALAPKLVVAAAAQCGRGGGGAQRGREPYAAHGPSEVASQVGHLHQPTCDNTAIFMIGLDKHKGNVPSKITVGVQQLTANGRAATGIKASDWLSEWDNVWLDWRTVGEEVVVGPAPPRGCTAAACLPRIVRRHKRDVVALPAPTREALLGGVRLACDTAIQCPIRVR